MSPTTRENEKGLRGMYPAGAEKVRWLDYSSFPRDGEVLRLAFRCATHYSGIAKIDGHDH